MSRTPAEDEVRHRTGKARKQLEKLAEKVPEDHGAAELLQKTIADVDEVENWLAPGDSEDEQAWADGGVP